MLIIPLLRGVVLPDVQRFLFLFFLCDFIEFFIIQALQNFHISQLLSPVLTSCVLDGEDMVGDDAVNPPPRPHLHNTRGELAALWCLFVCVGVCLSLLLCVPVPQQ